MTDSDRRVAIVNEHVRLENAHDFPACIAKFGRPRYEVIANGEVFDGATRVEVFLDENRRAFPDFHFEATRISPAADAVVVEGQFKGTHEGPWRGLPATGRKVDFAMCVIFDFEGDVMVNERLYFDVTTPLRQLGVADDPNCLKAKLVVALTHPVAIARAVLHTIRLRITHKKR
ncbi:MAG: ester cyclase [Acidimicrobiales bacterium]